MNADNAESVDVEVVLKADNAGREDEAVAQLRTAGMKVVNVDRDNGVIEGAIPAERRAELAEVPCVAYVRDVFAYVKKPAEPTPDQRPKR